jgi:hypothetical protein
MTQSLSILTYMKTIAVVDGQGGGIGSYIIKALKENFAVTTYQGQVDIVNVHLSNIVIGALSLFAASQDICIELETVSNSLI